MDHQNSIWDKGPSKLTVSELEILQSLESFDYGKEAYKRLTSKVIPVLFRDNQALKDFKKLELKILRDEKCEGPHGKKKSGSSLEEGVICISALDLKDKFDRWTAFPAALGLIAHELYEKIDKDPNTCL